MTSKELVLATLEFRNTEGRIPRQLWRLPWADNHYPEAVDSLLKDFDWDFAEPDVVYREKTVTSGDPYEVGSFVDDWGCRFSTIQRGVFGEVSQPLVCDDDWLDAGNIHIPEELLTFDVDQVNASCEEKKDKFLMAACLPRPFEQLQFIRGTANLYMDLMDPPAEMLKFMEKMHDYYCRLLNKWAKTNVDAFFFMDDWGSQNDLLINPRIWEEIFMPMYRDYINIAHAAGKKAFMHSDGNTLRIIPRLIDLGLDALNTQIFCIGVDKLAPFRGKLTFWGEIDRQNLLPYASTAEIDAAVRQVYDTLWDNGGCIAQCEFGAGANPDNVLEVYRQWSSLR